jgi:hypothetical protein
MQFELTDNEVRLLVDAVEVAIADKLRALSTANASLSHATHPFTRQDFGVDELSALKQRLANFLEG